MEIKIGDYEILNTGTVIVNTGEPIDFTLGGGGITVLRINLVDKKESGFKFAERFNETGVQINLINGNHTMGTGNGSPLDIGIYNNRKLFFNFRVYSLEKSGNMFHYTFLLGKEVNDGK